MELLNKTLAALIVFHIVIREQCFIKASLGGDFFFPV